MAATAVLPWAGLTHIPGQGEGAEREKDMEKLSWGATGEGEGVKIKKQDGKNSGERNDGSPE